MKKNKNNFFSNVLLILCLSIFVGCKKDNKKSRKKKSSISIKKEKIQNAFDKMVHGIDNDMLKAADPSKGKQLCSLCFACHNVNKGEPSKGVSKKRIYVGPSLYGVYERGIASLSDYEYSPSFYKLVEKKWSIENLDKFLKRPSHFAPGTKMKYPGVLDPQDRMDIIAYLMTNTVE